MIDLLKLSAAVGDTLVGRCWLAAVQGLLSGSPGGRQGAQLPHRRRPLPAESHQPTTPPLPQKRNPGDRTSFLSQYSLSFRFYGKTTSSQAASREEASQEKERVRWKKRGFAAKYLSVEVETQFMQVVHSDVVFWTNHR